MKRKLGGLIGIAIAALVFGLFPTVSVVATPGGVHPHVLAEGKGPTLDGQ